MPEKQWKRNDLLIGILLCLVIISPALVWLNIDESPFGGDPSRYGSNTLDLYRSWPEPRLWAATMITSTGAKPPGIVWLGQFFVPLERILGSVDDSLLLSIVATQTVTLLLVYGTLWVLSRGSILVSLAGCLIMAIGPLFQRLSHQYLVEPLQLLAVAWFVLIMGCAPRWNRALTLAQLVTAASVAMLAKASSPVFCTGPAVVALGFVIGIWPIKPPWGWKNRSTAIGWIVAILMSTGMVFWYYRNIAAAMRFALLAAFSPAAAIYGKEDTFFNSFVYWLDTARRSFFLSPALILAAVVIVSGLVCYLRKSGQRQKYFTLCCAIAAAQILFVLAAFSFGVNRQPRFLLALSPYFAILAGWGISHIGKHVVLVAANCILVFIWIVSAGIGLRLFDLNPGAFKRVPRTEASTMQASILEEIVTRTCADTNQTPYYNIIAIDPSLKGDWLAPAPADYVAARQHIHLRKTAPCSYGYIGNRFSGKDASRSWNSIRRRQPRYIVTFDPEIYPPSAKTYNQALNDKNFAVIFEKLKTSGLYELLTPLSGDSAILIFRAIEPSTGLTPAQPAIPMAN